MIKQLLSAFVASTAIASPVAAGIHDFHPDAVRPRTAQQTVPRGNCHKTRDRSSLCYMKVGGNVYVVAIRDVDYPEYPGSLSIDCGTGRWKSFSTMPKQRMSLWARTFCSEL